VAITVITEEDIRYSGANSIPEALRAVAGVDVVTLTAFDSEVNVRGFSRPWTNKLLVLIDGRFVYEGFFGVTAWNALPIQMGDIKKIEIIKGPGSVLYGANAYSGVVNIITKSPEESKGVSASFTGGQFNHYIASLIHGGSVNDLGYTISGGWEQAGRLSDADHDEISLKGGKARGQLMYKISDNSSASLEGGIVDSNCENFIYSPDVLFESITGLLK
jgi:iron complex outermembrane receptor protein